MMALVYLTRRETFSASHRLHSVDLSAEENARVFGKCNNRNGHGHNYVVEVTVRGRPDPRTGMVMNLTDLKQIIHGTVMKQLDHKNIDLDVDYFRETRAVSTTENLVVYVWKCVNACLKERGRDLEGVALHEIKMWESDKNIVVYRGE